MANAHFKMDGWKDSLITIRLDSVSSNSRPHDVEMGIINGVDLFGSSGDDSKGLWVEDFMTPVSRFTDLTHADATVHARHAHP
jgi:hypothetical protein